MTISSWEQVQLNEERLLKEQIREEIQKMVDKLKHDLYIRGIDENHCSDTYNMIMRKTYENVIQSLMEVEK